MCGHGPKISRSRLSIFHFHRTNSPNPWRPDLKENEAVGAAIWQNHLSHFVWFYRNFCFPSRFFKPRWSIAFFSCTRVSQVAMESSELGSHRSVRIFCEDRAARCYPELLHPTQGRGLVPGHVCERFPAAYLEKIENDCIFLAVGEATRQLPYL